MNFEAALPLLRHGTKMYLTSDDREHYYELNVGGNIEIHYHGVDSGNWFFHICRDGLKDFLGGNWMVYHEPHDFAWVVEQLANRKRVRLTHWSLGRFIFVPGQTVIRDCTGHRFSLQLHHLRATNWVLYEK
jgi:hypothetical protein